MAELSTSSAYDIKIESVIVSSDRLATEFEIAANVSEINVFENIDVPYLTGSILVVDSSDLLTQINFQGTEKITIKARINGDDTVTSINKNFVVTDIKVVPAQDTSEVFLINIIEEHAYVDRLTTISKAYDGKPEIIIAKILKDKLGLDINVPKDFSGSAIPSMKVIIPNLAPLTAARWVKDRLVSTTGMPFFLYSTLNSPRLFLTDLGFMLGENPMNLTRPYVYGQAFNRWSTTRGIVEQARNIESYNLPKSENMFGLAANGTLNSTYEFIDTVKPKDSRYSQVTVNMEDVLAKLVEANIISANQSGAIYDKEFTLNGKTIREYNPSVLTQIVSSNTFSDHANYYESEDVNLQKLKSIGRALRYYLLKSPVEITMPGFDFMGRGENITLGRQIKLNFLKNNPDVLQGDGEVIDPKRSGDYLVYACRHIIKPEKYSVALACVKLGNEQ